jgi:tetratricopeptide (TPR) repeat protein
MPSALAAPEEKALTLNNQGVGKLQQQDYQGAITDFAAAIKLQPDLAEAYLGRGVAYSVRRDHKAAIADYNQALALKPDLAEAYLYRADDQFFLQQKAHAIADLQQAQTLFTQRGDTENAKTAKSRLVALQSSKVQTPDVDSEPRTSPADSPETPATPTVTTEPEASEPTPIRAPMSGQCDCPYDMASNGSSCGGRSAYSRPGGREPICYANDES